MPKRTRSTSKYEKGFTVTSGESYNGAILSEERHVAKNPVSSADKKAVQIVGQEVVYTRWNVETVVVNTVVRQETVFVNEWTSTLTTGRGKRAVALYIGILRFSTEGNHSLYPSNF